MSVPCEVLILLPLLPRRGKLGRQAALEMDFAVFAVFLVLVKGTPLPLSTVIGTRKPVVKLGSGNQQMLAHRNE